MATTMPSSVAAATSMPSIPVMGETIPRSRRAEARSALEQLKLGEALNDDEQNPLIYSRKKPALAKA